MSRFSARFVGSLALAAVIGLSVIAQEPPKGEKTDKAEKIEKPKTTLGPTAKVEKNPIKIEVGFKGVFEASDMSEVSVKPEAWASLPVLKAVEPGTKVQAGDVLVEFDPEKIDKAIRDMEIEQKMADIQLKMTELDLPLAERATKIDQDQAERVARQAKEDFEKWMNIDKKLAMDSAAMALKSSESSLENQREELKQLEKMYRSKDLTEETEEIILKRQRFAVQQAEHFYKLSKNRHDQTLNVDLARREKEMRDQLERSEINLARQRFSIPMTLDTKRLAVEKAKQERFRSAERYTNLKKDRQLFTVKSPADGIVYYGKCVQGNWTGSLTKLQKGGTVTGDEVFMTIVKPGPLWIRGTIDEKDSKALAAGQSCKITTPAFPDAKLTGLIEKVASVPTGGNYEVRARLNPTDVGVIAGMSCMVKVATYDKKDALTIPPAAIFTDDADEDKPYVYKVVSGKPVKSFVKVGKKTAELADIIDGLSEGDEVLLRKPPKMASGEG